MTNEGDRIKDARERRQEKTSVFEIYNALTRLVYSRFRKLLGIFIMPPPILPPLRLLYQEIATASLEKMRSLDQRERKIALIALRSLRGEGTQPQKEDVQAILNKLKEAFHIIEESIQEKLTLMERVFLSLKRIQNIIDRIIRKAFGTWISVNQISQEYHHTHQFLNRPTVKEQIHKKIGELKELKEVLRFQEEEALPLYQNILTFYQTLPSDIATANPLLDQKIREITQQIKQARIDQKEQGIIHILEKEMLKSLTGMQSCCLKGDNDRFQKELHLMQRAWENTVWQCTSPNGLTQQAIREKEQEIAKYPQQ